MRALLLQLLICISAVGQTQGDSTQFSQDIQIEDGIYLTYEDLRHNDAITRSQLVSKLNPVQLDFVSKVMQQETFTFKGKDSLRTLPTKSAWGYVQNNTFYIRYKDEFYRVPVFGAISYFVAEVTVITPAPYDTRFGYPSGNVRAREVREFLFDFYSGKMGELSLQDADRMLSRDEKIYAEWNKLGRRKQKEQLYRFIRSFNASHPVCFLNNK
jgi:hypothetical protein